ncbi:hypothetical protein AVEN_244579-1 [Araneus ventricosus]|uniref:Uncharacterized protein n=1 Tax=Araneus ventricosus TaxID=182803 RepID=A0A4Y2AQR0_ARAVE|nr:hypothetical protein AVEN_244579-1 [Araneus ventricosus]
MQATELAHCGFVRLPFYNGSEKIFVLWAKAEANHVTLLEHLSKNICPFNRFYCHNGIRGGSAFYLRILGTRRSFDPDKSDFLRSFFLEAVSVLFLAAHQSLQM